MVEGPRNREALGFLASLAFTGLAAVRDVYFGGLFQRVSPLIVAVVAFLLCSAVFLPIALLKSPGSLRLLLHRPRELFWVNATTALAWLAFFHALRISEPLLVQILFSGIGPLAVVWIAPQRRSRAERLGHLGLLAIIIAAAAVSLAGLSGGAPEPPSVALVGVALATFAGFSISVSTVLCRRLNDRGVDPTALVALRFPGAVTLAAALAWPAGQSFRILAEPETMTVVLGASLLLIVFPIYVNRSASRCPPR